MAFQRQKPTDLWNFDGIYNSAPARTLTLSTEIIRYRLSDTEATARSLFTLALLEEYKGFLLAAWLQQGINYAMAAGTEVSLTLLVSTMPVAPTATRMVPSCWKIQSSR